MTSEARIVVEAPAKINLYLGVGAVRGDGYHEVETVLHAIGLSDTVVLEPAGALVLQSSVDLGIAPEENLAHRAAELLAVRLGREPGVRITLDKQIPAGAGLGGASSDAAAVLAGLPLLWGRDVDGEILVEVAGALGADVPFFLTGGTALYAGRGDVYVRHIAAPALHITLIKPVPPVSTAVAYATFDRQGGGVAPGPEVLIAACESGDPARVGGALANNMTAAAVEVVPEIAEAMDLCDARHGVLGHALAGSGSAVFAVCASAGHARRLALTAEAEGFWSCATRSSTTGVRRIMEGRV